MQQSVNLKAAIADADRLVSATRALAGRSRGIASTKTNVISAINRGVMRLGRALIPVGYTLAGRFDHDPALVQRDVPLLESLQALGNASGDEAKHLAVRAVRDLNTIRHALRQAAEAAESAVGAATGIRTARANGARGRPRPIRLRTRS